MITFFSLSNLLAVLYALVIRNHSPMGLLLAVEMLALSFMILWMSLLKSGLVLNVMFISFWMMFFIIMGACMGLVLLSIMSSNSSGILLASM